MRIKRIMLGLLAALIVAAGAAGTYLYLLKTGWVKYNRYDRRREGALQRGSMAPDVKLTTFEGNPLYLSALWKDKPVVLIFASCT